MDWLRWITPNLGRRASNGFNFMAISRIVQTNGMTLEYIITSSHPDCVGLIRKAAC